MLARVLMPVKHVALEAMWEPEVKDETAADVPRRGEYAPNGLFQCEAMLTDALGSESCCPGILSLLLAPP